MTAQGETVVARRHDALTFVPTDGSDVIVFDPATGQTHRLGGAASEIWTAIDGVKSIAEIVDAVAQVYNVEPTRIAADVRAAIEQFAAIGVVTSAGTVPALLIRQPVGTDCTRDP
ncbi:MAG TPA: HPr-rel-A system PqqD family peptide chaperone [Ilumatobacteraceae bacterium]|nr:HPr-rel-A system PqqD family peptide chaperone [Ilumatobacteraceae bacterium]